MGDTTVSEASSTFSAFLQRLNRDHNLCQEPSYDDTVIPMLQDIQTGEQEQDMHSKISDTLATGSPAEGVEDEDESSK
jgi:hypothetical protein